MLKNAAGQVWCFHAKNKTTGSDLTGETNTTLTLYVSKDPTPNTAANATLASGTPAALACIAANTVVELDSTNLPGWYCAPLAASETNGVTLVYGGKTTTTNGVVDGAMFFTKFDQRAPIDGHN